MTADQGQAGLDAFNEMLHAWGAQGITLDPAFADTTLAAAFPLADKYREGTIYMLASRLAPEYQVSGFDAEQFMADIRNGYMAIPTAAMDAPLTPQGVTLRNWWASDAT